MKNDGQLTQNCFSFSHFHFCWTFSFFCSFLRWKWKKKIYFTQNRIYGMRQLSYLNHTFNMPYNKAPINYAWNAILHNISSHFSVWLFSSLRKEEKLEMNCCEFKIMKRLFEQGLISIEICTFQEPVTQGIKIYHSTVSTRKALEIQPLNIRAVKNLPNHL